MPKSSKRRTLSPQFKFKVAVEGLKGIRPSKEIAAEHQVSPAQVAMWKRELLRKGSSLFEGKNARN
jgi:transposase-like protein